MELCEWRLAREAWERDQTTWNDASFSMEREREAWKEKQAQQERDHARLEGQWEAERATWEIERAGLEAGVQHE